MTIEDFSQAENTIVVSDIHLADAEEVHPRYPLWKRFKLPEHFVDHTFKAFLDDLQSKISSPIELVLNGDIFDFDSVMVIPKNTPYHVNWLERLRGLASEEPKSRFKIKTILDSHPIWVNSLREFVMAGNRLIFVIGNHDMELHWPLVQQDLLNALNLPEEKRSSVRFCEWFYISNKDTLIEHGNQYDAYCLCSNPVHPLIKKGSRILIRLPFGNLAGKFMVNGMGLLNPHANSSYIKDSVWDYVSFYYKYVMRTQPFLLWTWFWSAFVTLIESVTEGLLPALRDPLTVDARIQDIAQRANASVLVVLALKEVHVHPAIFNPFKILRELWLDRAILLGLIVFSCFQFFSFLNIFAHVSFLWFIVPLILLLPAFIYYASSVQSEVDATQRAAFHMAPLSARITKVKRIVQGHTHLEAHTHVEGIEVLNTGTWSPAYHDVACTQPYGRKCFAWIRPGSANEGRKAELYEWRGDHATRIASS
jgi:UDP-2,3-diacylglucosamine pyrophosphatase LpxH